MVEMLHFVQHDIVSIQFLLLLSSTWIILQGKFSPGWWEIFHKAKTFVLSGTSPMGECSRSMGKKKTLTFRVSCTSTTFHSAQREDGESKIRKFVLYSPLCPLSAPPILEPISTAIVPGGIKNRAWNRRTRPNSRLGPNSTSNMGGRFWHPALRERLV